MTTNEPLLPFIIIGIGIIILVGVAVLSSRKKDALFFFKFLSVVLAIIAIVSLVIAHSIILLIRVTDGFSKLQKTLTFLTLPISYCIMRLVLLYLLPVEYIASTSLIIMLGSTISVIFLIKKIKTNKFKTTSKMKHLRVEDGPRRNIRK